MACENSAETVLDRQFECGVLEDGRLARPPRAQQRYFFAERFADLFGGGIGYS